jgi:hypothetical protein
MRRNSGDDEGRNNMLDPTMKEHERARGKSGEAVMERRENASGPEPDQKSTGMGSDARKSGQEGDESDERDENFDSDL